jgi:hypothetical protein
MWRWIGRIVSMLMRHVIYSIIGQTIRVINMKVLRCGWIVVAQKVLC